MTMIDLTDVRFAYRDLQDAVVRNASAWSQYCRARKVMEVGACAHWAGANDPLAREIAFIAMLALTNSEIGDFIESVQTYRFEHAQCLVDAIVIEEALYNGIHDFVHDLLSKIKLN